MRQVFIVLALLFVTGCGGSALKLQAQAAYGFRTLNDEAVATIERICTDDSAAAARDPSVPVDVAAENAERILSTCHEIEDVQHPLAEAHFLWVMSVNQVLAGEGDLKVENLAPLGATVVRLYHELVPLARRLDFALPEVPRWLLAAVGLGGDASADDDDP